uniref:Zinc ABC transporter substrate-binding protein n=3 Tax=Rhodosorus marinus TaxID=101924 RepID=A0A7S3A9L8_9RHOD|mmetsp:Transcript_6616/g.28230  ORF Transcript_6616/g.28230 Transcript_6616/m.28230 type:complete len:333 (+) Transcript_6616:348-1346(+)
MSLPGFSLGGVLGSRSLRQRSLKRERVRRLCSDCCGGGGGLNNFGRGRGDGDEDFGGDEVFLLPAVVPLEPEEKLEVITTTSIITDLAKCIAGDFLSITGIIQPGDDPHVYEPVPTDSIRIESADIVLYNGFDLEMNLMPLIRNASDNCKQFAVGESVEPMPSCESTDTPDPHVWNDARNAACMVNAISDAFSECDPEHSRIYSRRARRMNKELVELDQWIKKSIQSVPKSKRMLVTTHDAFQYYARAYGLTILGTLMGINTEEQPSAKMMSELISEIRLAKPPVVFFEKTVSPTLIRAVAEDANVDLCDESLYSDSIGPEGMIMSMDCLCA